DRVCRFQPEITRGAVGVPAGRNRLGKGHEDEPRMRIVKVGSCRRGVEEGAMRRGCGSRAARLRRRRGASAAELALILPLFLTIVLGCVEFGRFLYYYVGVVNAARAGAAYGIMNNYSPATKTAWTNNANTTGQAEMTGMTGLDSTKLTVSVSSVLNAATGNNTVTSTATYKFKTITKWPFIPNTVRMTQSVQMRAIR